MAKILVRLAIAEPGENWLDETYTRSPEIGALYGWELPLDWTQVRTSTATCCTRPLLFLPPYSTQDNPSTQCHTHPVVMRQQELKHDTTLHIKLSDDNRVTSDTPPHTKTNPTRVGGYVIIGECFLCRSRVYGRLLCFLCFCHRTTTHTYLCHGKTRTLIRIILLIQFYGLLLKSVSHPSVENGAVLSDNVLANFYWKVEFSTMSTTRYIH